MIGDGSFNMGADTDSLYLASVYAGSRPVSGYSFSHTHSITRTPNVPE